jgi:hypothetical protein
VAATAVGDRSGEVSSGIVAAWSGPDIATLGGPDASDSAGGAGCGAGCGDVAEGGGSEVNGCTGTVT